MKHHKPNHIKLSSQGKRDTYLDSSGPQEDDYCRGKLNASAQKQMKPRRYDNIQAVENAAHQKLSVHCSPTYNLSKEIL